MSTPGSSETKDGPRVQFEAFMATLGGSSLSTAPAATKTSSSGGGSGTRGRGGSGIGIGGGDPTCDSLMPDLSHLTDDERRIIESVLMRQKREEEQETEIVR